VNSELKVRQYLACGKPIVISPGSNEFVSAEGFGTVVEPEDLAALTAALARWLALPPAEREAFAKRAAAYMHEHLSMAAALDRRLRLWAERMRA
jgi:glycosyltransferase involved in cell wall biosynthesis